MIDLDVFDVRILSALQQDGRQTGAALAETVPLSPSQIHRRIQRLEQAGLIAQYRAVLNPEGLGLGLMALTHVLLDRHEPEITRRFREAVARLPQILDAYAVTGDFDYILRVITPDLAAFSAFLSEDLMGIAGIRSVRSNVVLEAIKQTTALPLGHLSPGGSGPARP